MMANDYLRYKWGLWFKAIDVKREGKIHLEDKKAEGERFLEVCHFEERQKKTIRENLHRLYSEFIFGSHQFLTEEEFVDILNEELKTDKREFIEKMRQCGDLIYSIYDINGKRALTEEEFIHAVTVGSNEHVELVRAVFHSNNPFGGEISLKALTEAWVNFSTCEDRSKVDIIKLGLESSVKT